MSRFLYNSISIARAHSNRKHLALIALPDVSEAAHSTWPGLPMDGVLPVSVVVGKENVSVVEGVDVIGVFQDQRWAAV